MLAISGMATTPDSSPIALVPTRDADESDDDGETHRDQRAERDRQHEDGDEEADLLAAWLGVTLGVAEAAVVLHLDARRRRSSSVAWSATSNSATPISSVSYATVAKAVVPSSLPVEEPGS